MAITKIQCLNEAHTGNPAAHLKNALSYIQNPEKTEENVMVGSINCLPDTAFEQMMDTKVTFGKTNKRQGYHIIISFAPGEATEEQALDIVARFAQEYLKDKYEAVYAVHNDKKHMHGHIVFNSVSFETGMKHECKKGEWKHRMQPITNRLCKEYGLSIVPAEYVKEPKNLSRKEWEREQCFRKMILADAEFCQSQAGSFDHFIFLMKRIGYQFEYGKYLSVKVPGGKWYHELDKLDERFSKEKFRFYLDMPFSRPRKVANEDINQNIDVFLQGKDVLLVAGYNESSLQIAFQFWKMFTNQNCELEVIEAFSNITKNDDAKIITILGYLYSLLTECEKLGLSIKNSKYMLQSLLEFSRNENSEVRFYAYISLIKLININEECEKLILKRLSEAMDNEVYKNKVAIVSRVSNKKGKQIEYIISKGKVDNHFWVRDVANG